MGAITADTLNIRGAAAPEVIASVRGEDRFVVMDMARHRYLRGCGLKAALAGTRAKGAAGDFVNESVGAHLARVTGNA